MSPVIDLTNESSSPPSFRDGNRVTLPNRGVPPVIDLDRRASTRGSSSTTNNSSRRGQRVLRNSSTQTARHSIDSSNNNYNNIEDSYGLVSNGTVLLPNLPTSWREPTRNSTRPVRPRERTWQVRPRESPLPDRSPLARMWHENILGRLGSPFNSDEDGNMMDPIVGGYDEEWYEQYALLRILGLPGPLQPTPSRGTLAVPKLPAPSPGFTRNLSSEEQYLCVKCRNILQAGVALGKCGHVYCATCAAHLRLGKTSGFSVARCAVEDCKRIVSGKKALIDVYL